ncbi:MAG: hypothetical protein KAX69_04985 [Chitinophagales bacterium]|nr:hypothetical protein [Chitinophagales bacterium]
MNDFPTKEELQKRYSLFNDSQILDIIANKNKYTGTAVEVAFEELMKRNISLNEAELHSSAVHAKNEKTIEKKRLGVIFKLLYFLFSFSGIGFLIAYLNKEDYKKQGSVIKGKQILYYSLFGVGFMIFARLYYLFWGALKEMAIIIIPTTFILALLLENRILKK